MKKIYLSLSAIAFSLCAIAQQNFVGTTPKTADKHHQAKSNTFAPVKNKTVSTSSFSGRFDPSYALWLAGGFTTPTDVDYYVTPVFVDTAVISSFSSGNYTIEDNYIGSNFDPKSIIYDMTNGTGLVTAADAYYLDTVWVAGVYQRRGNNVDDTLYVNVVWGDTTNTSVWGKFTPGVNMSSAAPLNTFGTWFTPKYTTTPAYGNQVKFSAPASNRITIKHVLTKADSTYLADVSDYLPIVVNGATGQLIPANNIINASFTFNSGQPHVLGDCSYASSTAGTPGNISGWAGITWWGETYTGTLATLGSWFNDIAAGKNYSTGLFTEQRHKLSWTVGTTWATANDFGLANGHWLDFSIHYTAPTKVNELESKGFSLGQNMPNPFTNGSSVNFQLAKNVNSAVFTVTDVMGRVVSSENVGTTPGTHSVKLGSYAAGVYYYSLNVDGNVTTKKMIVE